MLTYFLVEPILRNALAEDIPYIDVTSDLLLNKNAKATAMVTAKQKGVIAGLQVFEWVFHVVDPDISVECFVNDSDFVVSGQEVIKVSGPVVSILKGERTALNFIQRMSGIATQTRKMKDLVRGAATRIVDTRKTTPGLRMFEKYAVLAGGGSNHRFGLSDLIMLKDNHIKALGGVGIAVKKAKEAVSHAIKVEVEVSSYDEFKEASEAGADIIMLDNMSIEIIRKIVKENKGRSVLEASGNISELNISAIAQSGVDVISMGALTHSYQSLDLSLNLI